MAAKDNAPFSPAKGNEAIIGIHFTWKREPEALRKILPVIEAQLESLNIKPHFGKFFILNGKRIEELFGDDLI